MTTKFPTALDNDYTNPTGSDALGSATVPHASQHANVNDGLLAVQTKVGIDGSSDTSSLEYRVTNGISDSADIDGQARAENIVIDRNGLGDSTPAIDILYPGTSSAYNYFLRAYNDTNPTATMFVNGTTRTADGGASTMTIRNDNGPSRFGNASFATTIEGTSVTTPGQPAFLIYTGGHNKAVGWEDIGLLTNRVVAYNNGNHWSNSTGLFTAPVSGYYLFYAGGWANYNGAGNRYAISFSVNAGVGGDWLFISGANTSAVDTPLASSPVIRYVNANEYVRTTMFSAVAMQLGTSSHKFYYGGYFLG